MKKLTEIYQIAYDRAKDAPKDTYVGICHVLGILRDEGVITFDEYWKARKHLYKNKPTEWRHIEFIADCSFNDESLYWWPIFVWEGRLCFLKKMIQFSKPWYKQIPYLWKQLLSIEKI